MILTDETEMTMAALEREADMVRKSKLRASVRDEFLRLNAFSRTLLEETGCKTIAEARRLLGLTQTKGQKHHATSAN